MATAPRVSTASEWGRANYRRVTKNARFSCVTVAALLLLVSAGCHAPGGALTVWAADGQERLTPESLPAPESQIFSVAGGEIRLTAALNETIGFQLALRQEAPRAGQYQLEISDLIGPEGTLPAVEHVSLYRVHPARVGRGRSWYPAHAPQTAPPTTTPDILVPWQAPRGGGPLTFADGRNELVWVDVRVPLTAGPGRYTGMLAIRRVDRRPGELPDWLATWGGGAPPPEFTCALHLTVLPVALPSEPTLPVICRVDPRDLLAAHLGWPREPAEETVLLPDNPHHQAAVRLVNATMRLLQQHRTNPILWASFPKYHPLGERRVEIQWEAYDRLVGGWLSGEAFPDSVALARWPVPVSLDYPNAQREGGVGSPRYARLLAAYLSECRRHFAERGWLERAFLRLNPPEELSAAGLERVRRIGAIVRQSETNLPLVAHVPPRSLRGLGYYNAPVLELPDVNIWAPPATWYEPAAMEHERALGRQTWLAPTHPPYSGTLAPQGQPNDALILPWQAFRYGIQALWLEDAAELGPGWESAGGYATPAAPGLVHPGAPYGLGDQPVPSLRLKRLRRGLNDHALLTLLERRGKQRLARSVAEQLVRWAGTDACREHLLDLRPTGWPGDAHPPALARELLLAELTADLPAVAGGVADRATRLAQWGYLLNQVNRVQAAVEGVRLLSVGPELRTKIYCSVLNATQRTIAGKWGLSSPPVGWELPPQPVLTLAPGARRAVTLEMTLSGLTYNTDGAYPFNLWFDTAALGACVAPARLAVAACPWVAHPPRIDGRLHDWPLATNNAAGDFQLVRHASAGAAAQRGRTPARPTWAFFARDDEHLYVGVRCALAAGDPPLVSADNRVPVDGAVPWGQDVVEILIDPRPVVGGTSSDIYCLQIKPNGVLVAWRGCPTDPPIGKVETWQSGAVVAVRVAHDAWVVELALPLAALDRSDGENRLWGLNVTRLDARRGEYSSWSGAAGYCYSPPALGNLILLKP